MLVGEGLTNRQIGDRLFISRHAVHFRLATIYAKLGINSRSALAREAACRPRTTVYEPESTQVGDAGSGGAS